MKRKFCYLYLTCETGQEEKIAQRLLEKHLVACAKFVPITSAYWWNGAIDHANESLIVLESAADLFSEIEAEVKTIHSYDTFVLTQVTMATINDEAEQWLNENLKEQK
jgi:periplasmic divalent cation tolerance protein